MFGFFWISLRKVGCSRKRKEMDTASQQDLGWLVGVRIVGEVIQLQFVFTAFHGAGVLALHTNI